MKKVFTLLGSACVIFIVGCHNIGISENDSVMSITKDVIETDKINVTNNVCYIEIKTKSYKAKTDSGKVVMEMKIEYPQIEGLKSVNARLEEYADEFVNPEMVGNAKDISEAMEFYEETHMELEPLYWNKQVCDITRNDGEVICMLNTLSIYRGGAHDIPYRKAEIIDAKTGENIKAEELLGMTTDEIEENVRKGYLKIIADNSEKYIEKDLKAGLENKGYYCNDEGVIYYLPVYTIGCFGDGFVEYMIPYDFKEKA